MKGDDFDGQGGQDDSLDVVSLVGDEDGDDNNLAEDDDDADETRSDVEFSTQKRRRHGNGGNDDDDDDRKSASPRFASNGFPSQQNSPQPSFGHPLAAAIAAGGKAALDGLLPAQLPPSAFAPHEYLARYYQMMQQHAGHSAAAALSAAVAASNAKIGSPGLHRSYENGIEQQTN